MEFLYKYPQQAFPYEQLKEENRKRGSNEPEYEILDTGVFDNNQYFDVTDHLCQAGRTGYFYQNRYHQPVYKGRGYNGVAYTMVLQPLELWRTG